MKGSIGLPKQLHRLAEDGDTVTPSLPEPGVWTGMASANALAPLRWKRAKIHRGSRRRFFKPHKEAGYTPAVVTLGLEFAKTRLQSGGVHIHPDMRMPVELIGLDCN